MAEVLRVIEAPSDTDFGIARIVELTDGSGRIETFNVADGAWTPSTHPKLNLGEVFDAPPVNPAFAGRIGLEL